MSRTRENRGGFALTMALMILPIIAIVLPLMFGYRVGAFNEYLCEGECPSEYALVPEGVDDFTPITQPDRESNLDSIDKTALEQAVTEALADPALGPSVGFVAADAASGEVLFSQNVEGYVPASTTKVLTAWGVLTALGPDHQFSTTVRRDGDTLILVGGGDPYLLEEKVDRTWAGTSIEELAAQTADEIGDVSVHLEYEDLLISEPTINPHWPGRFVPRTVQPITALNTRKLPADSRTPSEDAARQFSEALNEQGVTVESVSARETPSDAPVIVTGQSAPLRDVVSFMLSISDNTGSEILLRQLAIAREEPATFEGGVHALTTLLEAHGFPSDDLRLVDGSGLATQNRISPQLLVELLRSALDDDTYTALVAGMPVSGLSGSLTERFDDDFAGRGVVRAKTGTLIGVSSLAGWASLSDGRTVVFALMADRINGYPLGPPQDAVDRVAAAIATCAC